MHRPPHPARAALTASVLLVVALASACTNDGGSPEEFCAQVKKVPALEAVLARFSEADTDLLDDRIAKAREAYDDLAAAAPSEIDDETDQVVSLVNDILDAVEQNPDDPAKASSQLRKAMADHEGVDADRAKVAAYAKEQCDVQLDATLTEGTRASTTTTSTAGGVSTTTTGDGTTTSLGG